MSEIEPLDPEDAAERFNDQEESESLIPCPACGNDMSEQADTCPHCGSTGADTNKQFGSNKTFERYIEESPSAPSNRPWRFLETNEEVLWMNAPSWSSYHVQFALIFVLMISSLGLLTLGIFPLVQSVILGGSVLWLIGVVCHRITRTFAVTSKRAINRRGLVSKRTNQSKLAYITDVHVERDRAGEFFGYGTVLMDTNKEADGVMEWHGVASPQEVQTFINKVIEGRKTKQRQKNRMDRLDDQLALGNISDEEYEEAKQEALEEEEERR